MNPVERAKSLVGAFLKSYGPSQLKKILWDKEFSGDKWDFLDSTAGDCVYEHVEKFARNGSILDLGCGPGNTANEIALASYQQYVGVDISMAALAKASRRTEASGRSGKNRFEHGDIMNYVSPERFDVIMMREVLYHVPPAKVKVLFQWYARYLNAGGVFIVRVVAATFRTRGMLEVLETEFDLVEKHLYGRDGTTVLIFRPLVPAKKSSKAEDRSAIVKRHPPQMRWAQQNSNQPIL